MIAAPTPPTPPTVVVHVRDPGGFDVYIGRRAAFARDQRCHVTSPFANPHSVSRHGREEAVRLYEGWLRHLIRTGRIRRTDVLALQGKRLGCWCKDEKGLGTHEQPCHGDAIVRVLEAMLRGEPV